MYSLTSFFNRVEFYSSENDYKMQKGRACPYMVCHARHTVTVSSTYNKSVSYSAERSERE